MNAPTPVAHLAWIIWVSLRSTSIACMCSTHSTLEHPCPAAGIRSWTSTFLSFKPIRVGHFQRPDADVACGRANLGGLGCSPLGSLSTGISEEQAWSLGSGRCCECHGAGKQDWKIVAIKMCPSIITLWIARTKVCRLRFYFFFSLGHRAQGFVKPRS